VEVVDENEVEVLALPLQELLVLSRSRGDLLDRKAPGAESACGAGVFMPLGHDHVVSNGG
jgi:hypothetical protein